MSDHPSPADDVAVPAGSSARTATPIGTAMALLRCFGAGEPALGVTELAARVGRDKSSVSRMLATLEQEELVERDSTSGKYRLGLELLSLASPLLADLDVRRVARPVLERLAAATGESAALLMWSGRGAVTVELAPSRRTIRHEAQLGSTYATAESSTVRAFLAVMPEDEALGLLRSGAIAARETPEGVLARARREAAAGVHINYGATHPDEVGVSAHISDRAGDVCGTLLVSAPRFRTGADAIATISAEVRTAAAEVSTRLGAPVAAAFPPAGAEER